jgi:hypothetical protein
VLPGSLHVQEGESFCAAPSWKRVGGPREKRPEEQKGDGASERASKRERERERERGALQPDGDRQRESEGERERAVTILRFTNRIGPETQYYVGRDHHCRRRIPRLTGPSLFLEGEGRKGQRERERERCGVIDRKKGIGLLFIR